MGINAHAKVVYGYIWPPVDYEAQSWLKLLGESPYADAEDFEAEDEDDDDNRYDLTSAISVARGISYSKASDLLRRTKLTENTSSHYNVPEETSVLSLCTSMKRIGCGEYVDISDLSTQVDMAEMNARLVLGIEDLGLSTEHAVGPGWFVMTDYG